MSTHPTPGIYNYPERRGDGASETPYVGMQRFQAAL